MGNMFSKRDRNEVRKIRHERVRKKISGTAARPRLCVYRSLKHIYAQIIDDSVGNTLVAASTVEKEIAGQLGELDKKGAAKLVGKVVAQRARQRALTMSSLTAVDISIPAVWPSWRWRSRGRSGLLMV